MLDDYDGGRQVGAFFRENGREKILFIADNRLQPDFDRYEGLCSGYGRKVNFMEVPMSKKKDRHIIGISYRYFGIMIRCLPHRIIMRLKSCTF